MNIFSLGHFKFALVEFTFFFHSSGSLSLFFFSFFIKFGIKSQFCIQQKIHQICYASYNGVSLKLPTMPFRAVAFTINCFFWQPFCQQLYYKSIIFHYHCSLLFLWRAREQHSILQGEKGIIMINCMHFSQKAKLKCIKTLTQFCSNQSKTFASCCISTFYWLGQKCCIKVVVSLGSASNFCGRIQDFTSMIVLSIWGMFNTGNLVMVIHCV